MVFDTASGLISGQIDLASSAVCVVFLPNGDQFAIGDDEGGVTVWNVHNGKLDFELVPLLPPDERIGDKVVTAMAVRPDGKRLVTFDFNGLVTIWDLESRTKSGEVRVPFEVTSPRIVQAAAYAQDGQRFYAACFDKAVREFDDADPTQVETLQGHPAEVSRLALSNNGRWLAAGSAGGSVALWDLQSRTIATQWFLPNASYPALAFTKDDRRLLAGDKKGDIHTCDFAPRSLDTHLAPRAACPYHGAIVAGRVRRCRSADQFRIEIAK
jgi:WD40 repeat protein